MTAETEGYVQKSYRSEDYCPQGSRSRGDGAMVRRTSDGAGRPAMRCVKAKMIEKAKMTELNYSADNWATQRGGEGGANTKGNKSAQYLVGRCISQKYRRALRQDAGASDEQFHRRRRPAALVAGKISEARVSCQGLFGTLACNLSFCPLPQATSTAPSRITAHKHTKTHKQHTWRPSSSCPTR